MKTYSVTQAIERIVSLGQSTTGSPFLLGIVGPPGAGKSTLAALSAAPVLPMDGYHFANEHLDQLHLRSKKGSPETFDCAGFVSTLRRLRAGNDVVVPRFDRELDVAIAGAISLSGAAPLVLVEGNYLLHDDLGWDAVRPLLDEVWYIDTDDDLRRSRLIARHREFGRSAAAAAGWVRGVDEPNAALIRATRHRADAAIACE